MLSTCALRAATVAWMVALSVVAMCRACSPAATSSKLSADVKPSLWQCVWPARADAPL